MSVPLRERLLKMMVSDGMTPEAAFASVSSAAIVSIGLVLAQLTLQDAQGQPALTNRYERLRDWVGSSEGDEHPLTRSAMHKIKELDLDANHAFTIRALIAGLSRRDAN
jgi:hypothetical protein